MTEPMQTASVPASESQEETKPVKKDHTIAIIILILFIVFIIALIIGGIIAYQRWYTLPES